MTTTAAPTPTMFETDAPPGLTRPSLLRLTGVELRKLADTRAGRWLLITIGLAAAVIVTVQLFVLDDERRSFPTFFGPSLIPVAVLLPVLGILSVTSEWSQRTAFTTFALVPQRHRVVIAKIAAAVVAALLSVVASLAVAAIGTLLSGGRWSIDWATLPHATVLQVANVLIGVAFGMLLLNTPAAIVLYFLLPTVWSILGELVTGLREPAQWLDTSITMEPLMTADVTAGQWARLGVSLLVWLGAPLAVGLVRIMRQDVS